MWRVETPRKTVFLTFDDGPLAATTPWILDTLDRYGVHATFFMVADNVRRYPGLMESILERGHAVGNHTFHHLAGHRIPTARYMEDVGLAAELIDSRLFRPPHGTLRRSQFKALVRDGWRIVMYDVVTRDYARRITADEVTENVRRYTAPGSIIVFHDSLRSIGKLKTALPAAIEWLQEEGYSFATLPMELADDAGLR